MKSKVQATTTQKSKVTTTRQIRQADEDDQEIGDSEKGRAFLEERLLFVPDSAPLTVDGLALTLFQISALPGIGRTVVNSVCAVTYLLKEIELGEVAEAIRDIANAQFNEMTKDLKEFTEGLTEKMTKDLEKKAAVLEKKTTELTEVAEKAAQQAGNAGSYRDALTRATSGAPPDANPRLAAKESIRQRQLLIDLPKGSTLSDCTNSILVGKFAEAMGRATGQQHKIRSALKLQNGGILVEMVTDEGAVWLALKANAEAFLLELGESEASFKTRSFNVIAYYVPLTLDTNSIKDRQEIEETNSIPKDGLTKLRWIKPPIRRREDQRFAHVIATFSDAETANRAIVNGLSICHKRVSVAKCKKEPIRCLKCQGWDHIASECVFPKDVNVCGTCGGRDHWTSKCPKRDATYCTSCRMYDHTSWDRGCPTFLRKTEELNARDPANDLPFFPAKESWTWAPSYPSLGRRVPQAEIRVNTVQPGSQKDRYRQTCLGFEPAAPGGRPYTRELWARQQSKTPTAKSPPPPFPNPEFYSTPGLKQRFTAS